MEDKNYIYKKLSDGRYIKEIDNKTEHLATAQEDAKLATDIRSLLQGPQGESGTSGTSGQDGTSGRDGAEGRIGRTGLTGPRGQNGTSGSSGSSGQDGTSGINGQDGTSGINGRKGDKGDKGDRGFPGLQGPAGQNGSAGVSGTSGTSAPGMTSGSSGSSGTSGKNGLSSSFFRYNAHTNSYGPPIGTGNIEWNNATQTSATEIYTSHITQDNNDVEVILGGITIGSTLIIQDRNVSENYQKWTITSVAVTTASYVSFGVSYIDGGYSFTNGHDVIIIVQLAGVNGTSGTSGSSGVNGATGPMGPTGPAGTSGGGGSSVIRLTNQTLLTTGWFATGSYIGYTFSNANIGTASNVDFTPYNDSSVTAINARVQPYIYSGIGYAIFYAVYTPSATMSGDMLITTTI
jgi:hypothetical protein